MGKVLRPVGIGENTGRRVQESDNPGSGEANDGSPGFLWLRKFHSLHPKSVTWIRKLSTRSSTVFCPKRSTEVWEPIAQMAPRCLA